MLFIDASREYEDGKNQNRLRDSDIEKIIATFRKFKTVEKYAYRATLGEIRENEFNLNIPRYVDTFEPEPRVEVKDALTALGNAEAAVREAETNLRDLLKAVGYAK